MALYENSRLPSLPDEVFRNPGSEYRGTPFWSWNCEVTEELVHDQAEIFKEMGFGGFHIHARTGLKTPYLGKEFLKFVRQADEWAKENHMLCWLYDEDRYPSGAAGGIVTENMNYRARHLLLTREKRTDFEVDREAFRKRVEAGEKPSGYYLAAYEVTLKNGFLADYRRLPDSGEEERMPEEGREGSLKTAVWYLYVELMPESPWYNDQTYLDTLNPEAVREFIRVTHEVYYREFGEEFGKSIPAIFTDEPHMTCKMTLPFAASDQPVTMAYTDDIPETFEQTWHTVFLDIVPELFWELPDGRVSVHRYHYHDHLAERFVSAYSDQLGAWCEAHHIALTGHFLSERTLYSQTLALGEAMRCYRSFQLPGIDILADQKEFSTAKQAVSVARQYGREGVISELYGVTQWDADFKCYKLQGDWQAALGITIRCPHLEYMSMEGEAKRDWPASIGYQSPWYKKYSYVEDHFARLGTVLTRGNAVVRVGVIHPIESFWLSFGPNDQTQTRRDQMDENYENLMRWLLYGTIDFDLISESLLPGLCEQAGYPLKVGKMEYNTILVPALRTIRRSTLLRLQKFAEQGGKVIFAGTVPDLVDGVPNPAAQEFAAGKEGVLTIPYNKEAMLSALEPDRLVEIRQSSGKLSDNLFCQLREDNSVRWLFLCHVNRKRNRTDVPERYYLTVKGSYQAVCYDTISGMQDPIDKTACCESYRREGRGGSTVLELKLFAEDSLLLKLIPDDSPCVMRGGAEPDPETVQTLYEPDEYELDESNALALDYAAASVDGKTVTERTEILRLDNEVRKVLGYPRRQDKFTQPWRLPEEEAKHEVTLYYEFESEYEAEGAKLAIERPENAEILMNGEAVDSKECGWYVDKSIRTVRLPKIRVGMNRLMIRMPFVRKTNLEVLYVLGDFGVDLRGTRAVIVPPVKKLWFGDITRQRLPFYTGNITYKNRITLPEKGDYTVTIPHYKGAVMEIFVDGIFRGIAAYAPHRLKLADMAAGEHELAVRVYGNRFNGFGTLHNCNDEFMWYGPDSYRTAGSEWSEEYGVRPFGILSRIEIGRLR